MRPVPQVIANLALVTTFGWCVSAHAQVRLDSETIKAGLRTTVVEDNNYVAFLVTLVDQGRLSNDLIDTSFDWARKKTKLQYQYFKRAVITRADQAGIKLPDDTPPLRGDIRGRAMVPGREARHGYPCHAGIHPSINGTPAFIWSGK